MGDMKTLAKARIELEELYLGIPDESVNLTFQDLAELTQNTEKKKQNTTMEPISEDKTTKKGSSPLTKLPSLDFSKSLQMQASNHRQLQHHHHHLNLDHVKRNSSAGDLYRPGHHGGDHHGHATRGHGHRSHANDHSAGFRHTMESSHAYDDDASGMSMSMDANSMYQERGGRRRPGIPHSNICTICSTYIYIFRNRCLVCGRVYCRQCVSIGMGEMTEGRKCIECLGRRFSPRYIQKAGKMGCCWSWRYPSMVKQEELKWAEKGPRRSGERGHGRSHSGMMPSRSRSPVTPRNPTRAHAGTGSNPPSFVMSSSFSPYTPTHHHFPF